jgi:hypothetical protein
LALVALITVAGFSDVSNDGTATTAALREPMLVACGLLSAILLAAFTVTHVSGEYRYATIDQRLMAAPRRVPVLVAKLVAYGTLAFVVTAAALTVGLAIAQPLAASKDLSLDLTLVTAAQLVGSVLLTVVMFTLLAVIAAFITRSQPTGLATVFGAFLAEKLLSLVIGSASAYLPYGLLSSLLDIGGGTPQGVAAFALTGVTATLGLVAAALLVRRDVT